MTITFTEAPQRVDLFTATADTLVCPVNCVGVAGAGLAAEFKGRFPGWVQRYKGACSRGLITPGVPYLHVHDGAPVLYRGKKVADFPTKAHWRHGSEYPWIMNGVQQLAAMTNLHGLGTVAIPALGCGLGGLDYTRILSILRVWSAFLEPPARWVVFPPRDAG